MEPFLGIRPSFSEISDAIVLLLLKVNAVFGFFKILYGSLFIPLSDSLIATIQSVLCAMHCAHIGSVFLKSLWDIVFRSERRRRFQPPFWWLEDSSFSYYFCPNRLRTILHFSLFFFCVALWAKSLERNVQILLKKTSVSSAVWAFCCFEY